MAVLTAYTANRNLKVKVLDSVQFGGLLYTACDSRGMARLVDSGNDKQNHHDNEDEPLI